VLLTAVICVGIKVSSQVNAVAVAIKLAVVLLVIVAGFAYVKSSNYSPFVPPKGSKGAAGMSAAPRLLQDLGVSQGAFGFSGIITGAATVFFAFIGFDVVATTAEETRKAAARRADWHLRLLAICTTLYVLVSLVVTGMVHFDKIKTDAPLAAAFDSVDQHTIAALVSVGAIAGLTTVMLTLLLGQSRVFFAMARDGLLPAPFARVSERTGTPLLPSIVTGAAVAVVAALVPLTDLAKLVNIGTLFALRAGASAWWCCDAPGRTCRVPSAPRWCRSCRCSPCCSPSI